MPNEENKNDSASAGATKSPDPELAKIAKQQDSIVNTMSKLEQRLANLVAPPPQAKVEEENLEDLVITNPSKFVAKVKEQVKTEWQADKAHTDQAAFQFNTAFADLSEKFPELLKPSSKLYNRAKELMGEYAQGRANDAGALERAVFRASTELKIVASDMRQKDEEVEDMDDDSFSGSGSGSGASANSRKQRRDSSDLDPKTIEFARYLGMPAEISRTS